MAEIERRAAVEFRASGRKLTGYASVFGQQARIADFTEVVQRGAFAKSIASGNDLLLLVDHDPTRVLARTRAGSLRLSEDTRGLHFETDDLPGTQAANDILELIRTNNHGGASFAFRTVQERWDGKRRNLTEVDLQEVSVVAAWPAYEGTVVSTRAPGCPRASPSPYAGWTACNGHPLPPGPLARSGRAAIRELLGPATRRSCRLGHSRCSRADGVVAIGRAQPGDGREHRPGHRQRARDAACCRPSLGR
jgi:HK97 family phage prohead protease